MGSKLQRKTSFNKNEENSKKNFPDYLAEHGINTLIKSPSIKIRGTSFSHSHSKMSNIKDEILLLSANDNSYTKISKKPKLSNIIGEFLSKFYIIFYKKFKNETNQVVKILKEKYESQIEITRENIDQNIEIDLIFQEKDGNFF